MKIESIHARQILDSRGNPTVETDVILEDGSFGRASVPSGVSTGQNEALELRDNDPQVYEGKGVLKAIINVNKKIAKVLIGKDAEDQKSIDQLMINLDGSENKSILGANAILSVSLAVAKATAASKKVDLFRHIAFLAGNTDFTLPLPMMNIINGGKHAPGSSDIQEFMIMPVGAKSLSRCLQMGVEIFHNLGKILSKEGFQTTVGDEGGFAPPVPGGNMDILNFLEQAVKDSGYQFRKDIVLALDVAASELYKHGLYYFENQGMNSKETIDFYASLAENYPIKSIEDGLDQNDWEGWRMLNSRLGNRIQIVGDDLLVTNIKFLQKAIQQNCANAILIKPNQTGTVSETIEAVDLAKKTGWNTIISHRSGETEDTSIAHLAVGLNCGQIKTGSLSRTDRVAKYNELLRIEEALGDNAKFAGSEVLNKWLT